MNLGVAVALLCMVLAEGKNGTPTELTPSHDDGDKSLSFSFSYSGMEAENRETFDAWVTAAQAIPVDPEEYCSFFASEYQLHEPVSDVVTHPVVTKSMCIKDIGELFVSSTQQFRDPIAEIWITPRDVLMGFALTWCSTPCEDEQVVCGAPIEGTSLLTRFNTRGEIYAQHWFYDNTEIMPVKCPA